jgi:alkaline phosphatase
VSPRTALVLLLAAACAAPVEVPPPEPREPVILVGAGDIAVCDREGDSLTAVLVDSLGGFVFAAGDNLHDPDAGATYEGCYDPTWGRFRDRTFPAIGNHDYDYAGGDWYFDYFGERAGPRGKGFYSTQLGPWHLIVLNSNATVVPTAAGSEQEAWLRADLAANRERCTIAVWHHPRFYHGTFNHNGSVRPFWAALVAAKADVVLNGHFHLYERYAPQDPDGAPRATGPRQFTVGTGGRGLDALHEPAPNLEFRQNTTFGVLKLTLGDGWYEWEYISTTREVLDSGRAECVR